MKVRKECESAGKIGLVTRQYSAQGEGAEIRPILNLCDLPNHTHVLYIDGTPQVGQTNLSSFDAHRIKQWRAFDEWVLRNQCAKNGILFRHVPSSPSLEHVKNHIREFVDHTEKLNLERAQHRLEEVLGSTKAQWSTVLILDGDRTLSAEDTGPLLFEGY